MQYLANDPGYRQQHSKVLSNLSLQLKATKEHERALRYAQEAVELNRASLLNGTADTYPSDVYALIDSLVNLRDIFVDLDEPDSLLPISKELFTLLRQCHAINFSQVHEATPDYPDYDKGELIFDLGRDLWTTECMDETSQATAVDALRFCSEYLPTVPGQEANSLMTLNDLGIILRRRGEPESWIIPTMATHARNWFQSGSISVPDFTQALLNLAADQYQRGSFEEALDTLEEALHLLTSYVEPALEAQRIGVNTDMNGSSPIEAAIAFYLYALEMKQALLVLKAKGQGASPQSALKAALEILDKIESTLALFPAPKFYRARIWSGFYWRPKVLMELGDDIGALKCIHESSSNDYEVGSIDSVDRYSAIAVLRCVRSGLELSLQHLREQTDDQEVQDGITALEDIVSTEDSFRETGDR